MFGETQMEAALSLSSLKMMIGQNDACQVSKASVQPLRRMQVHRKALRGLKMSHARRGMALSLVTDFSLRHFHLSLSVST